MNQHRFIVIGFVFAVTALACNLQFSQSGEGLARETESALTLTATSQMDTGQPTITEEATATFTNEPTLTTTPTSAPTFTATFTALPPTSTFTPSPTPTDTPFVVFPVFPVGTGKINGFVFFDNNFNGVYNLESGELPAQSATARIMNGACPGGDIIFQASSKANGVFETPDLNLGTYCVFVGPNGAKWGGNYVPTTNNQRTVEVTLNNTINAGLFGFRKQ